MGEHDLIIIQNSLATIKANVFEHYQKEQEFIATSVTDPSEELIWLDKLNITKVGISNVHRGIDLYICPEVLIL